MAIRQPQSARPTPMEHPDDSVVAVTTRIAREATHNLEWSWIMFKTSRPGLWRVPHGHVGLPALVGQVRTEPLKGGLRPLLRFQGDKAPGLQHPKDGRNRRRLGVARREGELDRLGIFVEALVGERLVDGDDLVFEQLAAARSAVAENAARAPRAPRAA